MFIIRRTLSSLQSAWRTACNMFNIMRREYVVEQYLRAGAQFGASAVALFAGECSDVESSRLHWAKYERLYVAYGYRTISAEDFIEFAYGKSLDDVLRVKRVGDEAPVFHAERFNELDISSPGFAPLLDFAGKLKDWPHCHLNESHEDEAATENGGCGLAGCRERRNKEKLKKSKRWPF
ncbi:MAG TPA: hypothetical protein V6D22_03635 [Candidatus Obscuribacterales bacterium]